jgi:hypothetical protein
VGGLVWATTLCGASVEHLCDDELVGDGTGWSGKVGVI